MTHGHKITASEKYNTPPSVYDRNGAIPLQLQGDYPRAVTPGRGSIAQFFLSMGEK